MKSGWTSFWRWRANSGIAEVKATGTDNPARTFGSWISKKGKLFGLKFSLINFSFASLLLFISSYLNIAAFYFVFFAIVLISLGTSSFLPTSTDVVFSIAPTNKKGYALALLSQCFAMGYFFGPFISGRVLDLFGYASIMWVAISSFCFLMFAMIFKKSF